MVLETNCIRQPNRQLPSLSYNHNTLTNPQNIYEGVITNALQSCSKEVVTRRGKHSCYEGVQCMYCGCKMNWEVTLGLPYAISLQHQSKPLTTTACLSSLSATRATTLWLKQPTCYCSAVLYKVVQYIFKLCNPVFLVRVLAMPHPLCTVHLECCTHVAESLYTLCIFPSNYTEWYSPPPPPRQRRLTLNHTIEVRMPYSMQCIYMIY